MVRIQTFRLWLICVACNSNDNGDVKVAVGFTQESARRRLVRKMQLMAR